MTRKQSVRDVDVPGKHVLVRADLNVPLAGDSISDDTRVRAAIPTIQYLLDRGAAVVLMSHLGRPKGKVVGGLSLAPVADRLSKLLGRPVIQAPDSIGPETVRLARQLQPGHVLLLENLRFHPGEEKNDPEFARELSSLGDLYVNDAFGTAHRAHASTVGITRYLPAVGGLLLERELEALGGVLENPARPLAALIGGAKVSTKMGVLRHLVDIADEFLIGGGMANTFLRASGKDVGASLVEEDQLQSADLFLVEARQKHRRVSLPIDAVVAESLESGAESHVVSVDDVPSTWMIVDIGPATIEEFAAVLKGAGTVVWNGPMGIFEIPAYAEGTRALARVLADSSARTIVGGGDSIAALEQTGLSDRMTHISTGGGASLEFLEGQVLPGVAALEDHSDKGARDEDS